MNQLSKQISKQLFIDGTRCNKLAWNAYRRLLPKEDISVAVDVGNIVHGLGRQLFPEGSFAKELGPYFLFIPKDLKKPIFEAPIRVVFNPNPDWELYCRVDVLVYRRGWEIHEFKSATKTKIEHLRDITFQRYVFHAARLPVRKCFLWHLNSDYVREGDLDLSKLFVCEDVTREVHQLSKGIEKEVLRLTHVIESESEPNTTIGKYCLQHPCMDARVECPLKDKCWSFLPEQSVFNIIRFPKETAFQFVQKGKCKLTDVPESALAKSEQLSHIQKIQIQCAKTGKPHIDISAIRSFLDQLRFPLHFLDFETIFLKIPLWQNTSPGTTIPFQYSLHILPDWDADLIHYSFLSDGQSDPRPELLKRLSQEIQNQGSIIAYNVAFEISRLKESVAAFCEYSTWLESIRSRFLDLWHVFKSLDFYDSRQNGSTSIKAVLPLLTSSAYGDLTVSDGMEASDLFYRTHILGHDGKEDARISLCEYCSQDTYGMIQILYSLRQLLGNDGIKSNL